MLGERLKVLTCLSAEFSSARCFVTARMSIWKWSSLLGLHERLRIFPGRSIDPRLLAVSPVKQCVSLSVPRSSPLKRQSHRDGHLVPQTDFGAGQSLDESAAQAIHAAKKSHTHTHTLLSHDEEILVSKSVRVNILIVEAQVQKEHDQARVFVSSPEKLCAKRG